jgi:hypothetical protein
VIRSIAIVAVLLVALLYAASFLMWNATAKADIVTWNLGETLWVGGVPVGFLPLLGAIIGAAMMAVAAWAPWAGQRAATAAAEAKLQRAMAKLNEQKRALAARDEQIARLTAQPVAAPGEAGPAAEPLGGTAAPGASGEPPAGPTEDSL